MVILANQMKKNEQSLKLDFFSPLHETFLRNVLILFIKIMPNASWLQQNKNLTMKGSNYIFISVPTKHHIQFCFFMIIILSSVLPSLSSLEHESSPISSPKHILLQLRNKKKLIGNLSNGDLWGVVGDQLPDWWKCFYKI